MTSNNELDHESDYALLLEEAYQLGVFNTKNGCLIPVIEKLQSLINNQTKEAYDKGSLDTLEHVKKWADKTEVTYNNMMKNRLDELRTTK